MEALAEDAGDAPLASVEALLTEETVVAALREMLPSMDADTVTMRVVMQKLALRFGIDEKEIKAEWKPKLKEMLPDLLVLCAGGKQHEDEDEEKADAYVESEEEEVDLRPSRKRGQRATRKRHAVSDGSDEEDAEEEASEEEASHAEDEDDGDDEEDVVSPAKRRRISAKGGKSRQRTGKKSSPSMKKAKAVKAATDPPGLASLKELGRAAGVLGPQVYKRLNEASSLEEAEELIRERLHEAGFGFHGAYPSSRDISAAKKQRAKDKELEGIDTSLIITGGRARRVTAKPVSYKEPQYSDEEEKDPNAGDDEAKNEGSDKDDPSAEDTASSDSDASEASF
ncbi:hypothetical protein BBJ28_00023173 [Nothophytophthora sp. Chile5]|nr:hypothetical protein BBJ28_00023173 [Nothophytophthora sp. Chile5]